MPNKDDNRALFRKNLDLIFGENILINGKFVDIRTIGMNENEQK